MRAPEGGMIAFSFVVAFSGFWILTEEGAGREDWDDEGGVWRADFGGSGSLNSSDEKWGAQNTVDVSGIVTWRAGGQQARIFPRWKSTNRRRYHRRRLWVDDIDQSSEVVEIRGEREK
jgi:hypothetical protein